MNDIDPLLALYHKFCELTDQEPNDLHFHKHISRPFYEFHREGFTVQEMELVVRYAQAQNKKATAPEYRRKLVPSKIIGDLERFCEDLAEAKRIQALRVTPRQQVVSEFRGYRIEDVKVNAQSVKDVLRKAIG